MTVKSPTEPNPLINWKEYNASLRQRGRVDLLLEIENMPLQTGQVGRPCLYSDAWVEAILLLGLTFRLPLRQLCGFMESVVAMSGLDLPVPSPATLCERRQSMSGVRVKNWQRQAVRLAKAVDSGSGAVVVLDSTGLSIRGAGAWLATRPWSKGERARRTFTKLHIAIDPRTRQILAYLPTTAKVGDATAVAPLLDAVTADGTQVKTIVADGAYDTGTVYKNLAEHGVNEARIPPKEGARKWKESKPGAHLRNDNLTKGTRHRDFVPGGKAWKKHVRYGVRSLVETTFSRLHALCGNRLRSRSEAGRLGEIDLLMQLLNKQASSGLPMRTCQVFP